MGVIEIITALGLGGALTKLTDYWIQRRKKKDDEEIVFTKIFEAVHDIYYTLLVMLRKSVCHRILILKTTNGGGRPTLTGKLYGSVIYEAFETPLTSNKNNWQNQLLDNSYLELLFEMNKSGFLNVKTEELPEGILKDVYTNDGIVQSWIFKITERENEYIYLSANFIKETKYNSRNRELFRTGLNKLRNIFNENKRV